MPSQGRAVAAVSVALVLTAAVCYISFAAKDSETPTELIIEGKDGLPEAPGAGAELSAYSQILSFGPASDPAARTTPGDDQDDENERTPLRDRGWAKRYLETGQLYDEQRDDGQAHQEALRNVDCYFAHPVDVCDKLTSLKVNGQKERVSLASSSVRYNANCFYHYSVSYCESLSRGNERIATQSDSSLAPLPTVPADSLLKPPKVHAEDQKSARIQTDEDFVRHAALHALVKAKGSAEWHTQDAHRSTPGMNTTMQQTRGGKNQSQTQAVVDAQKLKGADGHYYHKDEWRRGESDALKNAEASFAENESDETKREQREQDRRREGERDALRLAREAFSDRSVAHRRNDDFEVRKQEVPDGYRQISQSSIRAEVAWDEANGVRPIDAEQEGNRREKRVVRTRYEEVGTLQEAQPHQEETGTISDLRDDTHAADRVDAVRRGEGSKDEKTVLSDLERIAQRDGLTLVPENQVQGVLDRDWERQARRQGLSELPKAESQESSSKVHRGMNMGVSAGYLSKLPEGNTVAISSQRSSKSSQEENVEVSAGYLSKLSGSASAEVSVRARQNEIARDKSGAEPRSEHSGEGRVVADVEQDDVVRARQAEGVQPATVDSRRLRTDTQEERRQEVAGAVGRLLRRSGEDEAAWEREREKESEEQDLAAEKLLAKSKAEGDGWEGSHGIGPRGVVSRPSLAISNSDALTGIPFGSISDAPAQKGYLDAVEAQGAAQGLGTLSQAQKSLPKSVIDLKRALVGPGKENSNVVGQGTIETGNNVRNKLAEHWRRYNEWQTAHGVRSEVRADLKIKKSTGDGEKLAIGGKTAKVDGVVMKADQEAHEIGSAGIEALGFTSKNTFEKHLEKEGI